MDFIRQQIALGRQAYIIYPLIEESSKLDYENLMKGFEEVKSFSRAKVLDQHGTWQDAGRTKGSEYAAFVRGETQIMVGLP